ncbi:MAG: hypothetical protein H6Q89_2781 [Myxococcaceae bacterium]|nr:hypothetical protein [Myxococcaceae bacterium]
MQRALMAAVLMLVGCGVSQTEVNEGDLLETDGAELSTTSRTYVTFTRDFRKCVSPLCGGWWVTDVNRVNPSPRYVNELDFSSSGLDEATVARVYEGDTQVVLRGKLGAAETRFHTRPFIVSDAWRGMPGVTATAGQSFFKVQSLNIQCFKAPCPSMKANRLNAGAPTMFDGLDVSAAALPRVDQTWLKNRVAQHEAIVTGKFVNGAFISGSYEKVLAASQVFVKLPEQPGPCPLVKMPACPAGKVRTYERNEDRCVLPSFTCVIPGMCALYLPNCAEGYQLRSWSGGAAACPVHACDPAFTL